MKTTIALITTLAVTLMAPALAIPLTGSIDSASNFSVIHDGSNPAGTGDSEDWRWFDAGQQIDVTLDNGIMSLLGVQTFALHVPSDPQQAASVTFTEMWLDLNDDDGFAGGYIEYSLDGTDGSFSFADDNYGDSPFNSSNWLGNELTVYLWGGDVQNDLGIDLAVTVAVAEPGVIALLLFGLTGVIGLRRRSVRPCA